MASLSFSTLLKTRDYLHKYNFCSVVLNTHGFINRSANARLSKQNFCTRFRGARRVLAKQPDPKNYASVKYSSSSSSEEITKYLWSVYNDTKKKTEGMHTHMDKLTYRPHPLHDMFKSKCHFGSQHCLIITLLWTRNWLNNVNVCSCVNTVLLT